MLSLSFDDFFSLCQVSPAALWLIVQLPFSRACRDDKGGQILVQGLVTLEAGHAAGARADVAAFAD